MDLRAVIDNILKKWGHNILLQRRVSPWDSEDVVYLNQMERHTVRRMHPSSTYLASLNEESKTGLVADAEFVYWFRWNANPGKGDRIYQFDSTLPNSQEIFQIDKPVAVRGRNGRIEYWVCGATQEEPN